MKTFLSGTAHTKDFEPGVKLYHSCHNRRIKHQQNINCGRENLSFKSVNLVLGTLEHDPSTLRWTRGHQESPSDPSQQNSNETGTFPPPDVLGILNSISYFI